MYEDENSKNRFELNQKLQMGGPFDTARRQVVSPNPYYHAGEQNSGSLMSHFNPRIRSSSPSYPSQSTYSQGLNPQQHRGDYPHQIFQNSQTTQNMQVVHHNNWVYNNTAKFPPEHYISFNYKGNNSIYGPGVMTGNYQGNTLLAIDQSQVHVTVNHDDSTQPYVQQNDVPCSTVDTMGHFRQFEPISVSTFPNQVASQQRRTSHLPNQEEADKIWLKEWLEQHVQSTKDNVDKPTKTLKICEAHNLFQRYLSLNNELKQECDELAKNIELEPAVWNRYQAKAEQTKEEITFVQKVFNDQDVIRDLQEKISKRKQKRLWLKNRKRRCYLEKQDDQQQRKKLHQSIDRWQNEIREKDLAARKAASLKHEAGGVLGEVRRKLQDSHKMRDLIKSLVKLREIRKSEGEKKGVYPKTSSTEDRNFTTRCEYVHNMVRERIGNYEEEEKAVRVIIMEEEGEREKKEKQERLQQKALLNLSKEADPLADFRRYYAQADESIEYLIKIRREWDMYLTPDIVISNRVPDQNITAVPPTSGSWASVLEVP